MDFPPCDEEASCPSAEQLYGILGTFVIDFWQPLSYFARPSRIIIAIDQKSLRQLGTHVTLHAIGFDVQCSMKWVTQSND